LAAFTLTFITLSLAGALLLSSGGSGQGESSFYFSNRNRPKKVQLAGNCRTINSSFDSRGPVARSRCAVLFKEQDTLDVLLCPLRRGGIATHHRTGHAETCCLASCDSLGNRSFRESLIMTPGQVPQRL
jgi:hypothetical protein